MKLYIKSMYDQLVKRRRISGHQKLFENIIIALSQLPGEIQQQVINDDSLIIITVGFGLQNQIIDGVYINYDAQPKKHIIVFDGCALSQMKPAQLVNCVAEEIAHYVIGRSALVTGSEDYIRNEKGARDLVMKWLGSEWVNKVTTDPSPEEGHHGK